MDIKIKYEIPFVRERRYGRHSARSHAKRPRAQVLITLSLICTTCSFLPVPLSSYLLDSSLKPLTSYRRRRKSEQHTLNQATARFARKLAKDRSGSSGDACRRPTRREVADQVSLRNYTFLRSRSDRGRLSGGRDETGGSAGRRDDIVPVIQTSECALAQEM